MLDPLSLLPFALAARRGSVAGLGVGPLVAAGTTLLQRCAPLVRTLAAGRTALLLPNGPAYVFALAASDGRGALLLDASERVDDLRWQMADANVRAVFTTSELAPLVGSDRAVVITDNLPTTATVVVDGREIAVDLGSHHGLTLEGEGDTPGRDEECLLRYARAADDRWHVQHYSHRDLLRAARAAGSSADARITAPWTDIDALSHACGALLAGAHLQL